MVDAPARGWPALMRFQAARRSGTGFTPRCSAKYLSSNRTVASMSEGEISRSGVQRRYFWSRVSVMRRTSPFRSSTRVEKSIPSSSGGFGKASQTPASTIARKIALRVHRLRTYFFTFLSPKLFRHADLPAQAARFRVAIVHRFREDRRHDKLSAIARLDLVS